MFKLTKESTKHYSTFQEANLLLNHILSFMVNIILKL